MSDKRTLRWLWFALAVAAFVAFLGQLRAAPQFLLSLALCLAYAYERWTSSSLRPAAFLGLATVLSIASFPFLAAEGMSRWWVPESQGAISPGAMGLGLALGLGVALLFSIRVVKPSSLEPQIRSRVLLALAALALGMLLVGDVFQLV